MRRTATGLGGRIAASARDCGQVQQREALRRQLRRQFEAEVERYQAELGRNEDTQHHRQRDAAAVQVI